MEKILYFLYAQLYKYKLIYARALYERYTRNNKDAQVMGFGLQLFGVILGILQIHYIDIV